MSKIGRIRILNLNYNNNTIRIDDETFDLGGQNTLISLRNGGGKSVLVQMIVSLFVNQSYRDFGERPFSGYFTTNRPTFLMTEWLLDNGRDRFLAGMMVRKNQKEDNDAEELELYTFTGSYSQNCDYDLDSLPVIKREGAKKILKGFSECKTLLEEISKKGLGDFRLYDMTSSYGRRQYFSTLRQYQINHKEWESIIRKVNQKESGLSELFQNAKDEKDLVENWFLRPIQDKLNQEKNRIDEFQKLAFQFIEQYRSNQSKIKRKGIIEQYFEDTKPLKESIDAYVQKNLEVRDLKSEMVLYTRTLTRELERLAGEILAGKDKLDQLLQERKEIVYEQLSYRIYLLEDQKTEILKERAEQEIAITGLTALKGQLSKQIDTYDLHKIYLEEKEFERKKADVDAKLEVLLQKTEESRGEIEEIGQKLYGLYSQEAVRLKDRKDAKDKELSHTENAGRDAEEEISRNEQQIRDLSGKIGAQKAKAAGYNETEDAFNEESQADLKRNLLGLYEDGALDIFKKEMEQETEDAKNRSVRHAKKLGELELTQKRLSQESADGTLRLHDLAHRLEEKSDDLAELERQKKERLRIMKYVHVEDTLLDKKDLILDRLDGRLRELDLERTSLIQEKAEKEKQFGQLKEGKTTELPDHVRRYLEENGIDPVYGMEWLNKNGRSAEENARLIEKNPFIPYAILMEGADFERFQKNEEELYTGFPIPIIRKEELEQEQEGANARFASCGNVHFYVMFNRHLLNREELEEMLADIRKRIDGLHKSIEDKNADLETYRHYRHVVREQTFSTALFRQTEKEIADLKQEKSNQENREREIKRELGEAHEERKQTEKRLDQVKKQMDGLERKKAQFEILCKKYRKYETDLTSLGRFETENEELLTRQESLKKELSKLREQEMGLRTLIKELSEVIGREEKKAAEFEKYAKGADLSNREELNAESKNSLEARYAALTREISDSAQKLKEEQIYWIGKISQKKAELKKKNEDSGIPEADYQEFMASEDQYDGWKRQKRQTEQELNAANENNTVLGKREGELTTKIDLYLDDLREKTGRSNPADRKSISDTEFEKRLNLKDYDVRQQQKSLEGMQDRSAKLSAQAAGMEDYADEEILGSAGTSGKEGEQKEFLVALMKRIPDVRSEEMNVIRAYQKEIRKKMAELLKALDQCRIDSTECIRDIAAGKVYEDDYFKKTFESLLSQTSNPGNLARQFDMNHLAYENQLEKLKIDLAHIDEEQKNLEMMFLEYVEQIHANLGMIDKNSTISVRGRSLKMLRIQLPDWEAEKEHFRLKLHDFFEHVIKMGIETIEKNGNLTEFLGRVITTKKLYDDVAGIQNVKIRLYKIEAEREVPISWSEVSANSGGEGFLSAFVILTCLLSYMRRDETDLFSSGEEGKVLIMDNPFAQTNAEHLLKPLVEMAKKTNTQLICLSGLGGDSIYNRFDNIYVLKLVESGIRNGVSRMDVTHMKGEETRRMVLSDFKMEQMSLFDMMEEA